MLCPVFSARARAHEIGRPVRGRAQEVLPAVCSISRGVERRLEQSQNASHAGKVSLFRVFDGLLQSVITCMKHACKMAVFFALYPYDPRSSVSRLFRINIVETTTTSRSFF